jgi:hypothetical protein
MIPRISGQSDPLDYNSPYDERASQNKSMTVPPLDIPSALAQQDPSMRYQPSTMEGSTGDVPIPAHYRDDTGNIYPIMPPTVTIDTGETLADRQNRLAQSRTQIPELKPIQQQLTEKNAKYSDPVDYLNDVKSHAYQLANAQGIDINSPDGANWMKQTMEAAKGAVAEYVVPPIKDRYKVIPELGIIVDMTNGTSKPVGDQGPEVPQPPKGTGNSEDDSQPQVDVMQRDIERAHQDPLFARTGRGRAALAEDSLRHKALAETAKGDEKITKDFNDLIKEDPSKASSRSLLGTVISADNRANRALDILNKPDITKEEMSLVVGDVAGIIQGGAPHESEMKNQGYNNLLGDALHMKQYILGNPQAYTDPAVKQRLINLIGDMKKTNQKVINQHLDSIEKTHPDVIKKHQTEWDAFKEQWGGGVAGTAGESADKVLTKDVAMQYLKQYGNKKAAMAAALADGYKE